MEYTVNKIKAKNYKNLHLAEGLPLKNLNIFIGPNGSGKSNLINVLRFLKDTITPPSDEMRGRSSFEDAVFRLGGTAILDRAIKLPATTTLEFEFMTLHTQAKFNLELSLLAQDNVNQVIINQEMLHTTDIDDSDSSFYLYKSHDKEIGKGVVAIYNKPALYNGTHFEDLPDVPNNELTLEVIPQLLESSKSAPENTPIYQVRRWLKNTISQWHFYNANEMNLKKIRLSEPKIGPVDQFLSSSGENLALVLDNLVQDINFEESINHAMKAILPSTRKVRARSVGRLSLAVEWHFDNINTPFYLSDMSDGTVRMLCWAIILHSPKLPALLVIDEPEIGVHVAWMSILAEWIKKAAEKTQVIICTHSPDLLDHFTDQTESVSVFKVAGPDKNHFLIEPLLRKNVSSWLEEGWQLGDLYRVGDPSVGGWPW